VRPDRPGRPGAVGSRTGRRRASEAAAKNDRELLIGSVGAIPLSKRVGFCAMQKIAGSQGARLAVVENGCNIGRE